MKPFSSSVFLRFFGFRLPMGSYVNQYEPLAHLLRAQSRIPDILAVAVDGRPLQRKMPGGA
uniref:hypothetical protein n=1 Tax=Pseudomonas aeruginosa TaxID=287 RepID=UPI00155D8B13|nr:hypothetical protein [Pseudomonas aeruginosa]